MTRTARLAEGVMKKAHIPDWVEEQRRRKWRWAGHVARRKDRRWTIRMLDWCPDWGSRAVGRPAPRWEDCFVKHEQVLGEKWRTVAQDRDRWMELEAAFAKTRE